MQPPRLIPAGLIVAALLVAACNGTGDTEETPGPDVTRPESQGSVREVRLGLGVQPWEDTRSAHVNSFATAGRHAELVSIARVPPW